MFGRFCYKKDKFFYISGISVKGFVEISPIENIFPQNLPI
jgi:hypothetical protein